MDKVIKDYLEGQLAFDSALREKYSASMIDSCIEYITEQARKELNGKNGAIADEKVFHWARGFFVDGIAEKQEAKAIISKMKSVKNKIRKIDFDQLEFDF